MQLTAAFLVGTVPAIAPAVAHHRLGNALPVGAEIETITTLQNPFDSEVKEPTMWPHPARKSAEAAEAPVVPLQNITRLILIDHLCDLQDYSNINL